MKLTIDEVKETLPELLESMDKEQKEQIKLYQEIIASRPHLNKFDISNAGHFYLCFIRPLNKFASYFIKSKISTDFDIGFIYRNSRYLESSFANIIVEVEGGAASSDKARRILAALVHHFKTGEPIVWDYGHEDSWCMPTVVFTNHAEIIAFYEGLSCLQQGNYTAYLQALAALLPYLQPAPASEAEPAEAATDTETVTGLNELSRAEILKGSLRIIQGKRRSPATWVTVRDILGVGSHRAYQICAEIGVEPDSCKFKEIDPAPPVTESVTDSSG